MKQNLLKRTLLLLCALVVGTGTLWAEDAVTASLILSSSKKFGTTSGSTLVDDKSNTWTCVGSSIQNSYQTTYSGQQFGTGSTNNTFTFSASIPNKTITNVTINAAAGNTTPTYDISIGGISKKSGSLSKTPTNYSTGDINATGTVVITLNQNSGGKAVYLGSIVVTYTDGVDPSITLNSNSVNAPGAGGNGIINVTYNNLTDFDADVIFYESDGSTNATYDHSWVSASINATTHNLEYSIESNTGSARTAYLKVYALDESDEAESELITITQEAYVAVSAVDLKSSTSIEVGKTETLTATISPDNASFKGVSWTSDNPAVATVNGEGVVTAVSVGTANITVTTEDGSFTATCAVTVKPASIVAATLDFTSNTGWRFPTSKAVGPTTYTNGLSITLQGSSGNGFYFDETANNLLLGKNGATLTLPAFVFNVTKIKVYGAEGASGSVTFNIFVGNDAVSTPATSSKDDHVFEIDEESQAAGTIYKIKVTNANNMRITKIEVFGLDVPVTIGSAGYTTFSAPCAVDFSETALKVYTAAVNAGKTAVELTEVASKKVPAGSAVILKGSSATGKVATTADALADNELEASDGSVTGNGSTIYALGKKNDTVGFYLVGNGVTIPAGKAYLTVAGGGVKEFLGFDFDGQTAIKEVESSKMKVENSAPVYTLAGQRVNKAQKGVFIVNGKKVVK